MERASVTVKAFKSAFVNDGRAARVKLSWDKMQTGCVMDKHIRHVREPNLRSSVNNSGPP